MKIKRFAERAANYLLALAMSLSAAGCFVESKQPFFTETDRIFDTALLGTWVREDKKKSTIVFEPSEAPAYKLTYYSVGEEPAQFEAHMVRLGNFWFLDTFPPRPLGINNDLYLIHILPTHLIFKIEVGDDTLRVAGLDPGKVGMRRTEISHELWNIADRIVLTAPTNELQEFVLKHAEDSFTDLGEWHRQPEGEQK